METKRLILRPFRASDFGDLYLFLKQLEEDEFEGYPNLTPEIAREQLDERLDSEEYYAMEEKESGRVVGNLYFGLRACANRELGYIVNEDFRRRGYAKEGIEALVCAAFEEGVHRVYAECDPRNERSWRLLESCGFAREAHLKENVYFRLGADGKPVWKDTYIYAKHV